MDSDKESQDEQMQGRIRGGSLRGALRRAMGYLTMDVVLSASDRPCCVLGLVQRSELAQGTAGLAPGALGKLVPYVRLSHGKKWVPC